MKKLLVIIPVIFLLVGFTINKIINEKVKSILEKVHLSEESANNSIFSNISGPSFWIPNSAYLKAVAIGDRTAMIETMGEYVKEYTSSSEFVAKYNQYREMKKPDQPEKPQTANELKEQTRKGLEEGIVNMKKLITQMPDQKAAFEETIKSFEQQLKDLDDPEKSIYNADFDNNMNNMYSMQMDQYNQTVTEWENEYPENNPKPMIKEYLQKFLKETDGVDFNAQLTNGQSGKKIFVKKEYESKSHNWKMFFRAGKESVTAARTFAQNWLSELN